MHQLARLAHYRHKVIPAARDVRLLVEAEDARGDGIAVMMVVKEPAVNAGLANGRLYCFEVHIRHDTRGAALKLPSMQSS